MVVLRRLLITLLVLTGLGLMASPAGASTPQAVTFTITVKPAAWAAVVSLLAPGSTAVLVYNSPAHFIYSFVCESGGKWSAPIPKKISQGSGGVKLRVKFSANQVAKADKAIRAESCGSDFNIHTVQQDYKWASENAQITSEIASLNSINTTTTTTAVPAQGAYFACTGSTPDGVSITYGTDSSNLNGASSVPWAASIPLDNSAQYYNVSAQLQGPDGSITCTTTVVYKLGGSTHTVTNSGSAQGNYNIASAEICSDDNGGWETC